MDFFYKNKTLSIESDKKTIEFAPQALILDWLSLDMAGEYEKWGFLAYTHTEDETLIYHITAEGYKIWYVPTLVSDLSASTLEFLGDIDILVMPSAKGSVPVIEKIEPRLIVTYGETAHELATHMGISEPPMQKYRVKEADLSLDKAGCVVMWE
jgi:Beta-lactamase superfamily domain